MDEPTEIDKLCNGCLCARMARESNTKLYTFCHGRVVAYDNECPCVDCLIKCICKNPCSKYDNYRKLYKGIISSDSYKKIK